MFERVTKYSLQRKELNNYAARITEWLVKRYINKVLIPALIEEGWDQTVFTSHTWFGDEVEKNRNRPKHTQIFWKREEHFFIKNGLYPTKRFLEAFKELTRTLENVSDGFLVKLRKTNRTKLMKEALKEIGLKQLHTFEIMGWSPSADLKVEQDALYSPSEPDDNEQLSIVEGEIEVVEIKTGKAIIPSHQLISYRKILEKKIRSSLLSC